MNLIAKKRHNTLNGLLLSPKALTLVGAVPFTMILSTNTAFAATGDDSTVATEKTGWIDVYVDHTDLDEAISQAESAGLTIVHDDSQVLTGDADATEVNRATAKKYYADKETEIEQATSQYKKDLANYESEQRLNNQNAANANATMAALRSNLAANGQTVSVTSKEYSAQALDADTTAINAKIEDGRKYNQVKNAIVNANSAIAQMVSYQTQADQGNIKLDVENVTVKSTEDVQRYVQEMTSQYADLEEYVKGLDAISGTIPEESKPTYKLYTFTVAPDVVTAGTAPVEIFNYTPVQAVKPVTPSISYHLYDIRSTPTVDRHAENADGETIIEATKESSNGQKVVQAMVNQTVGVEVDNQPLPSDRFDKIHNLEIIGYLPDGVEFDELKTNVSDDWVATYNKARNTVSLKATSRYLVKVNENQNLNNAGTVGGTVDGQWTYDAPAMYFKLLNDDSVYQFHSETVVNDEYLVVGETITIRTDSADPTKHNFNSKMTNIDGKAVLPGSINNYVIGWDFDQYKGVNIDRAMQEAGLKIVDDFPEEAVALTGPFTIQTRDGGDVLFTADFTEGQTEGVFTTIDGSKVNGLTWRLIDNDTADENLKGKLNGQAIEVSYKGFDNDFYKQYVEGGVNLDIKFPMTTLKIDNTPDVQGGTYNGNKYVNVAYQSDFGNAYKTNEVTNDVPLIDPRKDAVLSFADLTTLDINKNPIAEIEKGTTFFYRLSGTEFPMNLSEDSFFYAMTDEMPVEDDEYTGEYIVESNNAITFKAGSTLAKRYAYNGGVMPANTDLTKHTSQVIARNVSSTLNTATGTVDGADTKVTRVSVMLDSDFLEQIDFSKTSLQIDTFLKTKRVSEKDGVSNIFNEVINSIDFGSNEVLTNSKANTSDFLKAEIDKLKNRADEDDKDDVKFQSETTSALSVIVKTINDNKAASEKADDQLSDRITTNTTNIAKNSSDIAKAITTIANNAVAIAKNTSDIATNATNINTNAENIKKNSDAIGKNTEAIAVTTNDIAGIKSLVSDLKGKTDVKKSVLTIYDNSVTSDAEALEWAINHGVRAGSVKSITVDNAGRFVLEYNTSTTGITGSNPATTNTNNINAVAKLRGKIDLYTVKSDKEAYAALAAMGYNAEQITKLTNNGSVWTAEYTKAQSSTAVLPTEIKSVEDLNAFVGRAVKVGDLYYVLQEAKGVTDTTVSFITQQVRDGKNVGVPTLMNFEKSVITKMTVEAPKVELAKEVATVKA